MTTNSTGQAQFSFRLPINNQNQDSLIGVWNATVTVQTLSGTLQKSLTFKSQWSLEVKSINLLNLQGQNQTSFLPGDTIAVQFAVKNTAQTQNANITLGLQDDSGRMINQTQILNSQINGSNSNSTQIQGNLQIPVNASVGSGSITVALFSGKYLNNNLLAAQNQTAYVEIVNNGTPTISPSSTSTTTVPPASTSPTPTPNSSPTQTPPPFVENSVSLFSWLLVATGFFTFTMLVLFLKRKPLPGLNSQIPNLPIQPSTSIGKPQTSQPVTEKMTQATMVTPAPMPFETRETDAAKSLKDQEIVESIITQKPAEAMVSHLSKISSTGQRVQALEAQLRIEREQLTKEIMELNQTLDAQERAVKNYFDAIRQEVAKLVPTNNNNETQQRTAENKEKDSK